MKISEFKNFLLSNPKDLTGGATIEGSSRSKDGLIVTTTVDTASQCSTSYFTSAHNDGFDGAGNDTLIGTDNGWG